MILKENNNKIIPQSVLENKFLQCFVVELAPIWAIRTGGPFWGDSD